MGKLSHDLLRNSKIFDPDQKEVSRIFFKGMKERVYYSYVFHYIGHIIFPENGGTHISVQEFFDLIEDPEVKKEVSFHIDEFLNLEEK